MYKYNKNSFNAGLPATGSHTEQATVRIFYVGFDDDHKNLVVDYYPPIDGRVWSSRWRWTDKGFSREKLSLTFARAEEFKAATFAENAVKQIDVPCVRDACFHTTKQLVREVELCKDKSDEIFDSDASKRAGRPVSKTVVAEELVENFVCPVCKNKARLLKEWGQVCPAVFREGQTKSDPCLFPPKAWNAIKAWSEGVTNTKRSLYVCGKTGVGKSRMMYEILRELVSKRGFSFKVYLGGEFRQEQELIASTRFDRKGSRITSNSDEVDVLVFDDFGQDVLSDSTRSNLRLVIDKRLSNGLPTIFLSNIELKGIASVFGDGVSTRSLVRRMSDYCDVVKVDVEKSALDAAIERARG